MAIAVARGGKRGMQDEDEENRQEKRDDVTHSREDRMLREKGD